MYGWGLFGSVLGSYMAQRRDMQVALHQRLEVEQWGLMLAYRASFRPTTIPKVTRN